MWVYTNVLSMEMYICMYICMHVCVGLCVRFFSSSNIILETVLHTYVVWKLMPCMSSTYGSNIHHTATTWSIPATSTSYMTWATARCVCVCVCVCVHVCTGHMHTHLYNTLFFIPPRSSQDICCHSTASRYSPPSVSAWLRVLRLLQCSRDWCVVWSE
jgi:hypothetical protein